MGNRCTGTLVRERRRELNVLLACLSDEDGLEYGGYGHCGARMVHDTAEEVMDRYFGRIADPYYSEDEIIEYLHILASLACELRKAAELRQTLEDGGMTEREYAASMDLLELRLLDMTMTDVLDLTYIIG